MIPKDPIMLLSFLNLKLRDNYETLDKLCEDLELDKEEIISKMSDIHYFYNEQTKQFR